ncbi:hypothetical protein BKA93DRAFT_722154, partial [Sparassis latifolia]
KVYIVYTVVATYFAPSDPSGIGGMQREYIHVTPSWWCAGMHFDCSFIKSPSTDDGVDAFEVARILLFFTIHFRDVQYSCALIRWYELVNDRPDRDTGMWIVRPRTDDDGISVIHVDSIICAAHLIPVFDGRVPRRLMEHHSLDVYNQFYVNKYIDHHAFYMLF